jgi:hypothetical protein
MALQVQIGNRTVDVRRGILFAAGGFLIAHPQFFNTPEFNRYVIAVVFFTYAFFIMGVVSKNLSPVRAVLSGTALIALPIGLLAGAIMWTAFPVPASDLTTVCQSHAIPGVMAAKNQFTGETEVKMFIGDENCAEFPWYYESVDREATRHALEEVCIQDRIESECGFCRQGSPGANMSCTEWASTMLEFHR